MNLIPEEILDKIRQIANQFPNGGLEGDEVYFEIWIESNTCDKCGNHDFIYIKSLNYNDTREFLTELKKRKNLHPYHLFKVKKITWDDFESDWDDNEPFQSAEEISLFRNHNIQEQGGKK